MEDPWIEAPEHVYSRTSSLLEAPNYPEEIIIGFKNGDPISLNQKKLKPHELLLALNSIGGKHGVGRIDIVENRFVGMKSRGIYETPGGTILLKAHRAIESITLDRGEAHLKDELMPKYSEIILFCLDSDEIYEDFDMNNSRPESVSRLEKRGASQDLGEIRIIR